MQNNMMISMATTSPFFAQGQPTFTATATTTATQQKPFVRRPLHEVTCFKVQEILLTLYELLIIVWRERSLCQHGKSMQLFGDSNYCCV